MTIGPEPMIRTDLMELSLGILSRGAFCGAKVRKKAARPTPGVRGCPGAGFTGRDAATAESRGRRAAATPPNEKGYAFGVTHSISYKNEKDLLHRAVMEGGDFKLVQLDFGGALLFLFALVKGIIGMYVIKSVIPCSYVFTLAVKNPSRPFGNHGCPFFQCVNGPFHNPQIF
jgi:hypothetical protein